MKKINLYHLYILGILIICITIIAIIILNKQPSHIHETFDQQTLKELNKALFDQCKDVDFKTYIDVIKSYNNIKRSMTQLFDMFEDPNATTQDVIQFRNKLMSTRAYLQFKDDLHKLPSLYQQLDKCNHPQIQKTIAITKAIALSTIIPIAQSMNDVLEQEQRLLTN
jgi:hypothetical protein